MFRLEKTMKAFFIFLITAIIMIHIKRMTAYTLMNKYRFIHLRKACWQHSFHGGRLMLPG